MYIFSIHTNVNPNSNNNNTLSRKYIMGVFLDNIKDTQKANCRIHIDWQRDQWTARVFFLDLDGNYNVYICFCVNDQRRDMINVLCLVRRSLCYCYAINSTQYNRQTKLKQQKYIYLSIEKRGVMFFGFCVVYIVFLLYSHSLTF